MRIIAKSTLRQFWEVHPKAKQPLLAWYAEAARAVWQTPTEVKTKYRNASIVGNNRVVFNIKGNDYRLVVHVRYDIGIIFVRFVGTHREYDNVDVETI